MKSLIGRIRDVIYAYVRNKKERSVIKVVNGINFYFSKNFEITDEIMNKLTDFSVNAEDKSYSVYIDNGSLVIF